MRGIGCGSACESGRAAPRSTCSRPGRPGWSATSPRRKPISIAASQLQDGATEGVQLEFLLIRVQTGEVDGATHRWRRCSTPSEKGHPESAVILETIARAYIIRLRYKPAYACLSHWIEIQPDAAKPYQWRGLGAGAAEQP